MKKSLLKNANVLKRIKKIRILIGAKVRTLLKEGGKSATGQMLDNLIKHEDIDNDLVSETISGAIFGNLVFKFNYDNLRVSIDKMKKRTTSDPKTGRKAGTPTKRQKRSYESDLSEYKLYIGLETGSDFAAQSVSNYINADKSKRKKDEED